MHKKQILEIQEKEQLIKQHELKKDENNKIIIINNILLNGHLKINNPILTNDTVVDKNKEKKIKTETNKHDLKKKITTETPAMKEIREIMKNKKNNKKNK
jgi:hypothetical protein